MHMFQDDPNNDHGGVNYVYPLVTQRLLSVGDRVTSTNHDTETLELHPAIISVREPRRRLVTSYGREVNVAFALAEVLWILAGRKDVAMLQHYNSTIGQFSDNGSTFNAPYGHRMRAAFGIDQLNDLVLKLQTTPDTRHGTMVYSHPQLDRGFTLNWDIEEEQEYYSSYVTKDRACNLLSHAMIRRDELDWMQVLRSNDLVWGLPYNFMQWLHIMELVANAVGVPVGEYVHVADSLHAYTKHLGDAINIKFFDLYSELEYEHLPLPPLTRVPDLHRVMEFEESVRRGEEPDFEEEMDYWDQVIIVLYAHTLYKAGEDSRVLAALTSKYGDPVLGTAQLRFYWHHRWSKQDDRERVKDFLSQRYNDSVLNWITA